MSQRIATTSQKRAAPSFTELLQAELNERCRKNPRYSLRAFARSMGVGSSFMSKLLNGKRPLTQKTLIRFSQQLGLSGEQVKAYAADMGTRKPPADPGFQFVELEAFQAIADWYHYAILELVTVEGFSSTPAWIAKRLGLSVYEAKAAVERLLRLGYLAKDEEGRLVNVSGNNSTVGPRNTAAAYRTQQRQILELAIDALESVPFEERSQSSMTLAIPSSRLPEARECITEFRRKMMSLLQAEQPGTARDSVYQLSVSFYPVTKKSPKPTQRRKK